MDEIRQTIIFEGHDIIVRGECEYPGQSLVITFTSRRMNPKPTRAGFGVDFFRKRRIPAIHIIGLRNHWWQVPDMEGALRALKNLELRRFYSRITTYGSSMGGHGAMVFSGPLEAHQVLAFSPQFALHGREADWNAGWVAETKDLVELYRPEDHVSRTARLTVVADPLVHFDMLHLQAFRQLRPVDLLSVPFGVHPPMRYLSDQRMLSPLLEAVVDSSFDRAAFRQRIRERRWTNLRHLLGLASALRRRQQMDAHELVVTRAVAEIVRRLDSGENISNLADASALIGMGIQGRILAPEKALDLVERLAVLHPDESLLFGELAKLYSRCGRLDEAAQSARKSVRLSRNSVPARLILAGILLRSGEAQKGTEAARSALGLKSRNLRPWKEFLTSHREWISVDLKADIQRHIAP